MSSLFSHLPLWRGDHYYIIAQADFLHQQIDPAQLHLGTTCLMTCSSSLFQRLLEIIPPVDNGDLWPYSMTPLRVCQTVTGKRCPRAMLDTHERWVPPPSTLIT